MTPPSPRVHILFRPTTPLAVLIRTGGSYRGKKISCTIGWDRRTDRFQMGQWLGGRIYPLESDISKDGKVLVYNALNAKWDDPVTKGSWRAWSRAPWLKADRVDGVGSRWMSGDIAYPDRLRRDGWTVGEEQKHDKDYRTWTCTRATGPHAHVRKTIHRDYRKGRVGLATHDTHTWVDSSGTAHERDWEWAEVADGRLFWVTRAVLHAARLDERGHPEEPSVLYDCNPMRFQRIIAPY